MCSLNDNLTIQAVFSWGTILCSLKTRKNTLTFHLPPSENGNWPFCFVPGVPRSVPRGCSRTLAAGVDSLRRPEGRTAAVNDAKSDLSSRWRSSNWPLDTTDHWTCRSSLFNRSQSVRLALGRARQQPRFMSWIISFVENGSTSSKLTARRGGQRKQLLDDVIQ